MCRLTATCSKRTGTDRRLGGERQRWDTGGGTKQRCKDGEQGLSRGGRLIITGSFAHSSRRELQVTESLFISSRVTWSSERIRALNNSLAVFHPVLFLINWMLMKIPCHSPQHFLISVCWQTADSSMCCPITRVETGGAMIKIYHGNQDRAPLLLSTFQPTFIFLNLY